MLPLASIKLVAIAVAVTSLVSVAAGGFWYISGLRAELAVSEQNAQKLEQSVAEQKQVIDQLKKDQQAIKALSASLQKEIQGREKDLDNLRDRFEKDLAGRQRNFSKAAAEKPVIIEQAINRGTVNAARCMEIASGAPLTEAEKNATKIEQINKECPALANPNYIAPSK